MPSASRPRTSGNVDGQQQLRWVEDRVREAGVTGFCVRTRVYKLSSVCVVCGLDFGSKNKTHEGVWRHLGWTFGFFLFLLFLLGCKRPEEVNLRELMTSFPPFLNKAPSRQQEAHPAGHLGPRE